ncbi:Abi family protein [Shewanella algae]
MPNSITYTSLSNVLPHQRLAMYERVFSTSTPVELHGAYIWSVKAATCLHPLLSALEVALRNSIHTTATNKIGADWYDKLATRKRKNWRAEQRDKSNIAWHKQHVADVKKKISGKTPPKGLTVHDLLVAKMDFGFWDNLLRECFSKNGDKNALWPQCIPSVFPNLPKGQGLTNAKIQQEISILRALRNDIAHHSPIWKHNSVHDTQSAIDFINNKIDKILEVIGWLSSEKVDWIEVHMLRSEARRIVSKEYLYLCQRKNLDEIQQSYSTYKRTLRTKLKAQDKEKFDLIKTGNGALYMVTKITSAKK